MHAMFDILGYNAVRQYWEFGQKKFVAFIMVSFDPDSIDFMRVVNIKHTHITLKINTLLHHYKHDNVI
jgi:hypothetical protein